MPIARPIGYAEPILFSLLKSPGMVSGFTAISQKIAIDGEVLLTTEDKQNT